MNGESPQSTVIGTSSGKVILLGEHAVVYGKPALAAGIARGSRAAATPSDAPGSTLRIRQWRVLVRADEPTTDLGRAFSSLIEKARRVHPLCNTPVHVELETDLSPAAGLGCSASLGVALSRALAPRTDDDCIADLAMTWERVFHGSPSGVDVACAVHGGCIWFRRGAPVSQLRPGAPLLLCVGSSGRIAPTKLMVAQVRELRAARPAEVDGAFEAIGALACEARDALERGDLAEVGRAMSRNHELLAQLGVSTSTLDRMSALACAAGALGAKLTGAGGGGSALALAATTAAAESVLSAWKRAGFDGFAVAVASPNAPDTTGRTQTPVQPFYS
jgi:mevalonate kinase